jgi:hypothetical protein
LRLQVQAIAVLAACALLAQPATAGTNPLAEADNGKLACFRPDRELKTCWIIAAFTKTGDGTYLAAQRSRASNTTDYEMRGQYTYFLKDDRFCYLSNKEDIAKTQFFHLGDEVLHQDLEVLQHIVEQQQKENFGKTWCYAAGNPGADGVIPVASYLDGVQDPSFKTVDKLIWVTPEDGYRLRPTPD